MTGTLLAHYRIDAKLGSGPLGDVFRAWDTKEDRPVALRILPQEITSDRDRLLRFMDQVRAAAIVKHPNIAQILGGGQTDRFHFVVMEYVEGEPLCPPLPVDQCQAILDQLCLALQAAHAVRVPHRGIRPSNLLLTASGQVKLLDFGLLKAGLGRHQNAIEKVSDRAVPYLSPEQVMEHRREIGRRSDIFSLGVVMYELLTGELPFRGATPDQTMDRILDTEPKPPSEIRPEIPAGLDQIVLRCIEKERDHRYQSVQELQYELKRFREEPDIKPVRVRRRSKRRRLPVLPILLALAAVAGTWAGVQWYLNTRLPDSVAIAPFTCSGDADSAMCQGFSSALARQFSGLESVKSGPAPGDAGEKIADLKSLGSATLLTGSVARNREDLVVEAKLVSTADGSVLWSRKYYRRSRDLLALVYVVAGATAEKLKPLSAGDREWFGPPAYRRSRRFYRFLQGQRLIRAGQLFGRPLVPDQRNKCRSAVCPRFGAAGGDLRRASTPGSGAAVGVASAGSESGRTRGTDRSNTAGGMERAWRGPAPAIAFQ